MGFVVNLSYSEKHVATVREDRVWVYSGANRYGMHEYDEKSWDNLLAVHSLKFTATREIGGKLYSCLTITDTRNYSISTDVEAYPYGTLMSRETRDEITCLLREEDGTVYRLDAEYGGAVVSPVEDEVSSYHETVIYDWNKKEGEEIHLVRIPAGSVETEPLKVHYLAPVTIGGDECMVMTFADDPFTEVYKDSFFLIEGIGVTENGSLGLYFLDQMTGMADNSWYAGIQSRLERVYDGDGNVIYDTNHYSFVGVDDVVSSQKPKYGAIYDLMGRRVERVLPGSVYVRDGKKFVGK